MKKKFTLTTLMLMLGMCIILFVTCKKEMNVVSSGDQLLSNAAKATTYTSNEKLPVDEMIFVPCANGGAGENVHLTGTIHILIHTTVNKNNFTAKYHFQPQGLSGTGETTGLKYQASGVTQEEVKGSFKNGKSIDTFTNNFKIVGQGPGNNYLIHDNMHITVNANGETTATVDNFRSDCK